MVDIEGVKKEAEEKDREERQQTEFFWLVRQGRPYWRFNKIELRSQ